MKTATLLPALRSHGKLLFCAFIWKQHFSKILCIPFLLFASAMIFLSSSKRSAGPMCLRAAVLATSPLGRLELSSQPFALLVATCSKRRRWPATSTVYSSICILNWEERCSTFRKPTFCLGNLCWGSLFLSSWTSTGEWTLLPSKPAINIALPQNPKITVWNAPLLPTSPV